MIKSIYKSSFTIFLTSIAIANYSFASDFDDKITTRFGELTNIRVIKVVEPEVYSDILFNGTPIQSQDFRKLSSEEPYVSFQDIYKFGEQDVVLIGTHTGGSMQSLLTPALIIVDKNGAKIKLVKDVGWSLSEVFTPKARISNGKLEIPLVYENGYKQIIYDGNTAVITTNKPIGSVFMDESNCKYLYENKESVCSVFNNAAEDNVAYRITEYFKSIPSFNQQKFKYLCSNNQLENIDYNQFKHYSCKNYY